MWSSRSGKVLVLVRDMKSHGKVRKFEKKMAVTFICAEEKNILSKLLSVYRSIYIPPHWRLVSRLPVLKKNSAPRWTKFFRLTVTAIFK